MTIIDQVPMPSSRRRVNTSFHATILNWRTCLAQRGSGPGGVYNFGNLLALIGGITIQALGAPETQALSAAVWYFFFGSISASCLTLSMLIHLGSGEAYHRAWRNANTPSQGLVRLGDTLSGTGAVVLTIAIASYGDAILALIAGTLFAIGKFGSAIFPERPKPTKFQKSVAVAFRIMPMASRVPSLAALAITLFVALKVTNSSIDVAISILMLVCYLIWLGADYLLLACSCAPKRRAKQDLSKVPTDLSVKAEEPKTVSC